MSPPAELPPREAEPAVYPPALRWLERGAEVSRLTAEEAVAALVDAARPVEPDQLYDYALLNQQLQTYGAWTQARDTLQQLATVETLTPQQQQIVDTLLRYNQARINWYLKYQALEQNLVLQAGQLESALQETSLLQQKIQALTELEAVISTRKEE
ncbi:MAG: hypothetical protein KDI09_13585 [Halioglobus sp.]|nr:hypothetical protein [Halioglobus sp.]